MEFKKGIDKEIFWISTVIVIGFVFFTILLPRQAGAAFNAAMGFLTGYFGWVYILSVTLFLVFCLVIAISKFGAIRLGKDDERPEYSGISWFAMLFAAGMGIGLVFWGIAEPIFHFGGPPVGEAGTAFAAEQAMRITFFHWGLHAWGIYIVVAMALAYFCFRKGQPFLISSTFAPILGEKGTRGGVGKAIDILAMFATVFGIATSLGLGAMKITTGLSITYGIPDVILTSMLVIAVITVVFIISVVTGIDKGIKFLSHVNMVLAAVFILFFSIFGPTRFLLNLFVTSVGDYIQHIIQMSLFVDPYGVVAQHTGWDWLGGWTIFYWAWWIAWAPFVGAFIARISRGRTVRELVVGALIAPVAMSFVWLTATGGSAIWIDLFGPGGITQVVFEDVAASLFVTLGHFPAPALFSFLALVLVAIFFITSADSATLVSSMLTSGGEVNPRRGLRIFWGVSKGVTAAVLLYVGGLVALQTASIVAAFPFMIVMLFMMYCLYKAFTQEKKI
jgi:glycine betaine transporter